MVRIRGTFVVLLTAIESLVDCLRWDSILATGGVHVERTALQHALAWG